MDACKISLDSIRAAVEALDRIGTGNSRIMAGRAIHINVLIKQVPGADARHLKAAYNEIGAEAAVSSQVYARRGGSGHRYDRHGYNIPAQRSAKNSSP